MIENTSLILTGILFLMIMAVIIRGIVSGQKIIGKPPIPVLFFLLAKLLVIVNLTYLVLFGMQIKVPQIIELPRVIKIISLFLLLSGVVMLLLSILRLNRNLIFGLPDSKSHQLQTNGIYAFSRHPFYLGFIFILFSSCLFTPNILNCIAFTGAWLIHHFIMIEEEKSLESMYGDEYKNYKNKVRRYLNIKYW